MSQRRNPIARVLRDLGGGVHRRSRSGERQLLDHEVDHLVDEWFEERSEQGREESRPTEHPR